MIHFHRKQLLFQESNFQSQMSMAVEPKAKGDEDKIGSGLQRLAEEDPTFSVEKMQRQGKRLFMVMGTSLGSYV